MPNPTAQKIFRFAPSPNGYLHLGHAYSALLNFEAARASGGQFLLRIEDIDTARSRPEFEAAIFEDLSWLGLDWQKPVLRQSTRTAAYRAALAQLQAQNLLYPCFCTRRTLAQNTVHLDPDGAAVYAGRCKHLPKAEQVRRMSVEAYALRLDMTRASQSHLIWQDGAQTIPATPEIWGDIILARKDIGTSYHLAVTLDDAAQGVTDVVRGQDLFASTHIHRLLQHLLGLPTPRYQHHALLRDAEGEKLAKSRTSKPLRLWRAEGASPGDVRKMIGLTER